MLVYQRVGPTGGPVSGILPKNPSQETPDLWLRPRVPQNCCRVRTTPRKKTKSSSVHAAWLGMAGNGWEWLVERAGQGRTWIDLDPSLGLGGAGSWGYYRYNHGEIKPYELEYHFHNYGRVWLWMVMYPLTTGKALPSTWDKRHISQLDWNHQLDDSWYYSPAPWSYHIQTPISFLHSYGLKTPST